MRHAPLSLLLVAAGALAAPPVTPTTPSLPDTAFWGNDWASDTTGDMEGTVLVAQNQVMPSKNMIDGDKQPHLTAWRAALVLFKPRAGAVQADEEVRMEVTDATGATVAAVVMAHPHDVPKHPDWMDIGADAATRLDAIDFADAHKWGGNVAALNDEATTELARVFNEVNAKVTVELYNGRWTEYCVLPPADTVPADSAFLLKTTAGYKANVKYPNTVTGTWHVQTLSAGEQEAFVISDGSWVCKRDVAREQYVFGHGFLSATVAAEWVQPGMGVAFVQDGRRGVLADVRVGGASELLIHAIDAGFLTEPRGEFAFRDDATAHREYYEVLPVSRLVVAQYEALHLTEIMLPTGTLYATSSAGEGGWHSGDMRQATGKVLISQGIDMANYGMWSSSGNSERAHPYTCAQLAAHNTVGMYTNGRQVHGGSGGNGIITLDSSIGNEMSHEGGHNYGLGHYTDGFFGSVHRPANATGSTWGWDSRLNVFVPNFAATATGEEQCCCDPTQCQQPFAGRQFGKDSQAGGSPLWAGVNRFTLHTPASMVTMQSFFEGKAVFARDSPTGFRKYDPATGAMAEFANPTAAKAPTAHGVAVTTVLGYYDPEKTLPDYVFPALHGAYGYVYEDDTGRTDAAGCELRVDTAAGTRVFALEGVRKTGDVMNKFHVNVAAADGATSAAVFCKGEERVRRALAKPKGELVYTVNGRPLEVPVTAVPASVQGSGGEGEGDAGFPWWAAVLVVCLCVLCAGGYYAWRRQRARNMQEVAAVVEIQEEMDLCAFKPLGPVGGGATIDMPHQPSTVSSLLRPSFASSQWPSTSADTARTSEAGGVDMRTPQQPGRPLHKTPLASSLQMHQL